MRDRFTIALLLFLPFQVFTQCLVDQPGIIWQSNEELISFKDLAHYAAPMLWFSPDEVLLKDENGQKQIPIAFPFEEEGEGPIVYYKIRSVYAQNKITSVRNAGSLNPDFKILDLKFTKALDLDFYYYFRYESGKTKHLHDIESITLQIRIIEVEDCPDYKFAIVIKKVTGRAHGNHWYDNSFTVDAQTFFPLSILIEEGKHASCTDKNADGIYTPTYDVTERINDAWGVRDIITSGRLVTGGFQAWMAKSRDKGSIVFPPLPKESIHYINFLKKFGAFIEDSKYSLRPYPEYKKYKEEGKIESKLDRFMKDKKPHVWPNISRVSGNASISQWIQEEKSYNSLSLAYRWDDAQRVSLAFPLLFFKNIEAPKTGGWVYNKLYIFDFKDVVNNVPALEFEKLLGHQITYSSSASRWIDTYIGMGYEVYDANPEKGVRDYKTFFVSEVGVKIRLNVERTALQFLRHLGTDFWGTWDMRCE